MYGQKAGYKETVCAPLAARLCVSAALFLGLIALCPASILMALSGQDRGFSISMLPALYKAVLFGLPGPFIVAASLIPAVIIFYLFRCTILIEKGKLMVPGGAGCDKPIVIDLFHIKSARIKEYEGGLLHHAPGTQKGSGWQVVRLPFFRGKGIEITYIETQRGVQNLIRFLKENRLQPQREEKTIFFPSAEPEKVIEAITRIRGPLPDYGLARAGLARADLDDPPNPCPDMIRSR
jgi:hypothetical protein